MCVPATSGAQVLQPPERAAAPATQSVESSRLTFSATTLGTFDDNLMAEQGAVNPNAPPVSGYTGYADSALRFDQTKGSRSFGASGRAYLNAFRNVGLSPAYGGDVQANFGTTVGRRHRVDLRQLLRNEPLYAFGSYSGLRQTVDPGVLPDANPLNGLAPRRSWVSGSRVDFSSKWSPRDSLGMSLGYDTRDFIDQLGDSRAGVAAVSYNRAVGRRSSWKASYNYGDTRFLEPTGWIPSETHGIEGAVGLERRFSPTRRLVLSFGGGGIHIRSRDRLTQESFDAIAPSGSGVVRLDWARTWSLSADFRRGVGTLDGLSSQVFATDAGLARVGGFVARATELTLSVAYSEGQSTGRETAAFDTYTGTSQLRFELTGDWSAVVSHTYYRYSFQEVRPIGPQLPPQMNRNAIRVGLSLNLPVVGGRTDGDRRRRD
jgi:hypothetical protein